MRACQSSPRTGGWRRRTVTKFVGHGWASCIRLKAGWPTSRRCFQGTLLALQAVLADTARQGVDQSLNLGGILSGAVQPLETADLLKAQNLPTIRGNHGRQLLALLEKTRHGWQVDLRAVPWDPLAHALATGFIKRPVAADNRFCYVLNSSMPRRYLR